MQACSKHGDDYTETGINHMMVKKLGKVELLNRYLKRQVSVEYGLHFGQFPMLHYILLHENCSQRELADAMDVSPPSIAVSVKRMQRAGWVEKETDESDMRMSRLRVTEAGRKLVEECHGAFAGINNRMMQGFSREELSILDDFLERIINNFSEDDLRNKDYFALLSQEHERHHTKKKKT